MPLSCSSMRSTARCVLPVLVGPSSATLWVASASGTLPACLAERAWASGSHATLPGRALLRYDTSDPMALNEALRQRIDGLVASDRVVLFMKGSRRAPQCGFS